MVVVRSSTTVALMPLGITAWRKGKLGADALVGLDDVGARLAEDDAANRGIAVQVAGGAHTGGGVLHVGNVGEVDCEAIVVSRRSTAGIAPPGGSGRW